MIFDVDEEEREVFESLLRGGGKLGNRLESFHRGRGPH